MSNHYEVEHDIKPGETRRQTRRPDMSTFLAFLNQLVPPSSSSSSTSTSAAPSAAAASLDPSSPPRHFNAPTPGDTAALFRLVREQYLSLASTAPSADNRSFLDSLVVMLDEDVVRPPVSIPGVSAEFVDSLDRVPRKRLRPEHACPICAERFLDDPYPLVVQLPCHSTHRFDLECVEPWLRSKGSCPMCRKDFSPKPRVVDEDEEDEELDDMYA